MSDVSDVGEVDEGDEGWVEPTETEDEGGDVFGRGMLYITLKIFMRSA